LPGGGGHGPAQKRPAKEVRADLAAGYITPDQARQDYGFEEEEA